MDRFTAVVEVEEDVYSYKYADNGSMPLWCHGSTCIVRSGNEVFASGLETIPGAKPLNNCVPMLFWRTDRGWKLVYKSSDRTREPSPLVGLDDRVLLSANPTLIPPDTRDGPAQPQILEFPTSNPDGSHKTILPVWQGNPPFTEHSYRSFLADRSSGEMILFQNIGMTHAEWAFCNHEGVWSAQGQLAWPWGDEYDEPQPIRIAYPVAQLKNRAVYLCGVSNILEPYKAWSEYKFQITGKKWDYDLRRLFFTWSDDISSGKFHQWIEVSSRDKTGGWLHPPRDMWVGPDGKVHILWTERALDERLRSKFFPLEKQVFTLNYAVIHQGVIMLRRVLHVSREGESSEVVNGARFQSTPDERLFVFYHVGGKDAGGKPISENRLLEILSDGTVTASVSVPLQKPIAFFFTATERGGSQPSEVLDVLGDPATSDFTSGWNCLDCNIRYARIRIK